MTVLTEAERSIRPVARKDGIVVFEARRCSVSGWADCPSVMVWSIAIIRRSNVSKGSSDFCRIGLNVMMFRRNPILNL